MTVLGKRIAILTPGGIAKEDSGMHIPAHWNLVSRLSESVEVHVFSLAPENWTTPSGTCGNANVSYFPIDHRRKALRKIITLFNACRRKHLHHPFDLVHAFWAIPCGSTAVMLRKYLGIPAVVTFLGGESASLPHLRYGNMSRIHTRMVTSFVARRADAVVSLTHHQAQELEQLSLSPRRTVVIPLGAEPHFFVSNEKDISRRPLRLLHVANLHPIKDQNTLMSAFHSLLQFSDARLRIIGEDQSGESFTRLAHKMRIADKIELLGRVRHHELRQHYEWAQVLIHTSLHEAQAVVVAEAAAAGVLIAGTRTGLVADFGDERAVVANVGDHLTLSSKIQYVVANPRQYDALRKAGQQWALEHSSDYTLNQHLDLYDELIRG